MGRGGCGWDKEERGLFSYVKKIMKALTFFMNI